MKRILFTVAVAAAMFAPVKETLAWGKKGQRITAKVAELYLTPKAKSVVEKILGNQSISMASTWCEEMTLHPKYNTTPCFDSNSSDSDKNTDINLVNKVNNIINELKKPGIDAKKSRLNIRSLIYYVGKIHQPLNIQKAGEPVATDVKVKWFGKETTLYEIWNEELIEHQKLSYVEYVEFVNWPTDAEKKKYLACTNVKDWANESSELIESAFRVGDKDLSYQYSHDHIKEIEKRLLQGGMHLAAVLNMIYSK